MPMRKSRSERVALREQADGIEDGVGARDEIGAGAQGRRMS